MINTMTYNKGDSVKWEWGSGEAEGEIEEVFTEEVTRTIKGNEVTRKASEDEPAYLIKQGNGDKVLKSHSEVSKS